MKKFVILLFLVASISLGFSRIQPGPPLLQPSQPSDSATPPSTPIPTLTPKKALLTGGAHAFQTFNNCGPAALSMALSHHGIVVSQKELGDILRPYQNAAGDNDDKSTTLEELGEEARRRGLLAYFRPAGSIEILEKLIAQGLPVVTRTLTKPHEDIGHYRVVVGYDSSTQTLFQDDSLQGNDLIYTYHDFDTLWSAFNREYLVIFPSDKLQIVDALLGLYTDEQYAWRESLKTATGLNTSVALYHLGDYTGSISAYEEVASQLPMRALWYQIEPLLSYYEIGNDEKVMTISHTILNNGNRAFSELYLLRGNTYRRQGKLELAQQEYDKAILYNHNFAARIP